MDCKHEGPISSLLWQNCRIILVYQFKSRSSNASERGFLLFELMYYDDFVSSGDVIQNNALCFDFSYCMLYRLFVENDVCLCYIEREDKCYAL